MKTDIIKVRSTGAMMEAALDEAEKAACYKGLSHRDALHLRLLTEEALGMMRSIAGDVGGEFWIEDSGGVFELHLRVETGTDAEQRKKLLSTSSSGKNDARRGIMGKIRSFFEPVDEMPVFFDSSVYDSAGEMYATGFVWSLRNYENSLRTMRDERREGADDAWDELEKSVIKNVADDVRISILGRSVEMTIIKKMG